MRTNWRIKIHILCLDFFNLILFDSHCSALASSHKTRMSRDVDMLWHVWNWSPSALETTLFLTPVRPTELSTSDPGGGEPWNPGGGEPCRSAVSVRSVQTDHIVKHLRLGNRSHCVQTDNIVYTSLHPSAEKCDHLCKYRWEYPEPITCKYKYRVINSNCILWFLDDRSEKAS